MAKELLNQHIWSNDKHVPSGGIEGQVVVKSVSGPQWGEPYSAPTGAVDYVATKTPPLGYLKADGSAVSRETYSDLFNVLCPVQIFSVTIASPAVFTAEGHGLIADTPVRFMTSGSLPDYSSGINADSMLDRTFYVIAEDLTENTFKVSDTLAGQAIGTVGVEIGVHMLRSFRYGIGDEVGTFNVPDIEDPVLLVCIKY